MSQPPLLIHIVFHPASQPMRELALHLHHALNDDPVVPGLRIPTQFCADDGTCQPPAALDLEQAARSFIVPLADNELYTDDDWCRFVADTWERCQASRHRCVPFQLAAEAWPLDQRLRKTNFVRAFQTPESERSAAVARRLIVELCRYLHGDAAGQQAPAAPTTLFISHTKMDIEQAPQVYQALTEYIKPDKPIKAWIDTGDIPGGSTFSEQIEQGVSDASLLCVLSDNYASREWCRKEILLAKEKQRPIVVVDALSRYEVRSFPYLGNLPVLHWNEQAEAAQEAEAAVDLLLKETLRDLHSRALLKNYSQPNDEIFTRAPELLTITPLKKNTRVLYPDPPLGVEETAILGKSGVKLSTPLERIGQDRSLRGKKIALSLSESTDLARFGYEQVHLESAMLELNRYLLLKGTTLAYGGHLGSDGYTASLAELVRSHNSLEGVKPVDRLEVYLGWPIPLSTDLKAHYKEMARIQRIARPVDIDESLHSDLVAEPEQFIPGDQSAVHRYAWARGMSEMRRQETTDCVARIVLGGKFGLTLAAQEQSGKQEKWYVSRIPGVLEEVMLSVKAQQPVFLIGAFGGVAGLVIDLLEGKERPEMSWDYQKQAPFAPEMRELYAARNQAWWDYPAMVDELRQRGISGINPLLSEAEHKELFHTRDVAHMIELIVRGLQKL